MTSNYSDHIKVFEKILSAQVTRGTSTDRSKAFDCLQHPLLLAQVRAHGFIKSIRVYDN